MQNIRQDEGGIDLTDGYTPSTKSEPYHHVRAGCSYGEEIRSLVKRVEFVCVRM
jgi:hypothetical protein